MEVFVLGKVDWDIVALGSKSLHLHKGVAALARRLFAKCSGISQLPSKIDIS
jgi:hypothetical protein